ncbi:MAG: alpha,alpha-trehalose-phosphate synthase (UDP-forming), partial [Gemmatimonadales bacterium]
VPRRVRAGDRVLSLGVHPVGINATAVQDILANPERRSRVSEVRDRFQQVRLVVSIERLDYVKGPLQKLAAFEQLLERHPSHREKVSLVFVMTPAAPGMEVYDDVRTAVDEAVGRINGRFGSLTWTPVHYLYRSVPFDEVIGYCAAADVAWITPLRDGLNLVAKEFVMAQKSSDGAGVLLLSEFAGAAVELHGALLTNPYDIEGMTAQLDEALSMPEPERRNRMDRLGRIVSNNDVADWSRGFLDALAAKPS